MLKLRCEVEELKLENEVRQIKEFDEEMFPASVGQSAPIVAEEAFSALADVLLRTSIKDSRNG